MRGMISLAVLLLVVGCGKSPVIDTEIETWQYSFKLGSDYRVHEVKEVGRDAFDFKSNVPIYFSETMPEEDLGYPHNPRIVIVENNWQSVVFIECSKVPVELEFKYYQNVF